MKSLIACVGLAASAWLAGRAMADPPWVDVVDMAGDEGGFAASVCEVAHAGGVEPDRTILYSNSGYLADPFMVTRAGGHCGINGDATDLQTTLGLNIYGWGCQGAPGINNAVADDFIVPSGQNWTVAAIILYMYQTAASSPSITSVNYQFWMVDPTGQTPDAWTTVPVTALFTTTFKKLDTDAPTAGCGRRLQKVVVPLDPPVEFGPGQYWLAWQALGSSSYSGPWQPPIVVPGATGMPRANGMQSINGGPFSGFEDPGAQAPEDFVFVLTGSATGQPGAGDGDLNCDGLLNAFDIDPFRLALGYPSAYPLYYPSCTIENADINDDGLINAFDIDPFVYMLVHG